MAEDTMLHWLATACKTLREDHRPPKRPVHIAAALNADQATIYRFEEGKRWTRDPDAMIAAYAEVLGVDDPREIWQQALQLWREEGDAPLLEELLSRRDGGLADALAAPVEEIAQAAPQRRRRAGRKRS